MAQLYHHPLCPQSRFVRLALAEYGIEPELIEERPFERRHDFLLLDPAGQTPVLIDDDGLVVPGAACIAAYLEDVHGAASGAWRLLPADLPGRVEVRRLFLWFSQKFFAEVSNWLVTEKVYKRYMAHDRGGGAPDMELIRAARTNIRYHLRYVGFLVGRRNWLAGTELSFADLAAAAHLSSIDFLGDVPWDEDETAKHWYARVKSRPSFRTLLADRLPGMAPAAAYADLDF
jgi:glutathione S-transferase